VNSQGGNPKSIITENTEEILKQKHIMKEQLVKISETIYLIFLPADVHNFNVQAEHLIYREEKLKLWKYFKIGFDFKIHGTCTLPMFDFDFEVDESWVEKKKFNKGVFIEDTYLYRDYLSSNENMCFVGLPEYECRVKSFKSKIQKAIQDEGMFVVNPYGEKRPINTKNCNIFCGKEMKYCQCSAQLNLIEIWQSAESKTVKGKILIIEKL